MRLARGLPAGLPATAPAVVTIGNVDGVHRGHRAIVDHLRGAAGTDAAVVVITFDPHPRCVLVPDRCPVTLTTIAEKASLLAAAGVDELRVLPFDRSVSEWSADTFLERLGAAWALQRLVVGPDFALGHRRSGDIPFLVAAGARLGFAVEVVEPVREGGAPVSSTRVRDALAVGEVEAAASLLGHPYLVDGPVEHGDGRGRGLGFPTANVGVPVHKALPAPGVYAGWAHVAGRWWMAATNVGVRPTFDGTTLTVEPHLLDCTEDLYGQTLRLCFTHRLREERRYEDVDALVAQMHRDVARARELCAVDGPPGVPGPATADAGDVAAGIQ